MLCWNWRFFHSLSLSHSTNFHFFKNVSHFFFQWNFHLFLELFFFFLNCSKCKRKIKWNFCNWWAYKSRWKRDDILALANGYIQSALALLGCSLLYFAFNCMQSVVLFLLSTVCQSKQYSWQSNNIDEN